MSGSRLHSTLGRGKVKHPSAHTTVVRALFGHRCVHGRHGGLVTAPAKVRLIKLVHRRLLGSTRLAKV